MNDLEAYFLANEQGALINKWHHYFEIYDRHFSRFRGTTVNVLEFGVSQGGSLQMWKNYLGPNCRIYGVDINPECRVFEAEGIEIHIGDQADRQFLRTLVAKLPQIDIVIEDGGHLMDQQIATFEEIYPKMAPDGVFLIEDLHTSYWPWAGGGYRQPGTFVEYSKGLIDGLNAWHSRTPEHQVNEFSRSTHSMHYYDSILVLERRQLTPPRSSMIGRATVQDYIPPPRPVVIPKAPIRHRFRLLARALRQWLEQRFRSNL